MSIVSGSQQGIEVTTAAMDETLATQAQANGVDEIVVTDVITSVGPGNGNITAPSGYAGRLCILRQGDSDEETRLITAERAGTGNTRILTVAEPWVSIPVITTDTIHVSYSSDDMEAFTGMTLNAKTGVYEGGSTREWQIGQGTNFAYCAVFNYQGWEITDRGSNEPGLTVRNNGRLDFGYIQGGSPIQGAIVTSTNNLDGEIQIEIEAGGILRAYATIFRSWLNLVQFSIAATCDVRTDSTTIKNYTEELLLLEGTHTDLTIAGSGTATEFVRLAEETSIIGLVLAGTNGLTTEASDTSTETIVVRDASFLSNLINITVEANKTWDIINPVWTIDEASHDDLVWLSLTANAVNERYSLDPVVQDATGTKINGARVFIYEGLRLDDLVQELTSDSDGLAPGNWVYKNFVDADSGAAEVSTVTTVADVANSLLNTFFEIDLPTGEFYVWYEDGVSPTDPAPAGKTGIQVTYTINDTANTIASLTNTAMDAVSGFGTSVSTNVVTVTNDDEGSVTDLVDGSAATGFTLAVTGQGADDSLTVLTDGDHALRVDNYGDFPFIAAQVSTAKFAGAVVLNPDTSISEATQSTAITAGSGATFNTDSNPSEIFDFTIGVNTLGVGETLTFSSGATGIVTEITAGDSVAGTVHLSDRNATAIVNGDTISSSATWTGTYTNDTQQQFGRWIDGNGLSLQILHDYFAARTAEASGGFTAEAEVIHEWGNENEQRAMYLGADGFFTNRSGTDDGVFISDYGAGTVDFFTADDGTTFIPPTTTTITFTGMKDNSEVRVYETGTAIEIAGIENATAGTTDNRTFAWATLATTVVDYKIHNWLAGVPVYETIAVNGFTVPADNQSIGIQQRLDRNAV